MILKKCRAETLLIFLNVLLTIFFELNSIKNFQSYELSYSVADGLVSCLNVRIIGMCGILSAIVAEIVIFKNDFKINYAIRNKSRQKIFLKQVLRLFWFSFFGDDRFLLFCGAFLIIVSIFDVALDFQKLSLGIFDFFDDDCI